MLVDCGQVLSAAAGSYSAGTEPIGPRNWSLTVQRKKRGTRAGTWPVSTARGVDVTCGLRCPSTHSLAVATIDLDPTTRCSRHPRPALERLPGPSGRLGWV